MQTVVYICNTVLCRFKDGLRTLNVLQAVERHTDAMRSVFVHQCCPLTASDVDAVFKMRHLSERGSNRWQAETRTLAYWADFLQDLEGLCVQYIHPSYVQLS